MENKELFPFQKEGVVFLKANKTALLADEMGLGKSAQLIVASEELGFRKIIIVCPSIAKNTWKDEFDMWSVRGLKFFIPKDMKDLPPDDVNILACSFEYAAKNFAALKKIKWQLLGVDESHLLKSLGASRTKSILGAEGIVHAAQYRWFLSGTPAPNGKANELWPMLYVFGKIKYTYDEFVERFCHSYFDGRERRITGTKKSAIPELNKILKTVMLRRLKVDVLKDLPPLTYQQIHIDPSEVDLEITTKLCDWVLPHDNSKRLFELIDKQKELVSQTFITPGTDIKADSLMALAQSVPELRRFTGLRKVKSIVDMIKTELSNGAYQKVVIFAIHTDVIDGIEAGLKDFGAVKVYGATRDERRRANILRFKTKPECRVFIGNIQAAGTNIDLTVANQLVFAEMDWVPGNNAQAAMRVHRITQKSPVNVRIVSIKDSIDSRVDAVLKRKTEEITAIVND